MQCLLLLALLASSAAATVGIEPPKRATSNSTSQLLHLTLTPHMEHLVPLPTAQSVSPDSDSVEPSTSPAPTNPLADLARKNQEKEEEPLEAQPPESCIQGVAEAPCPLMDVRRRCGSALPIGIDRALNYTFLHARFSLVGGNFTLTLGFQDKEGKSVPLNGTDVAGFSDIIVKHACKRGWGGWLKWARDMAGAGLFSYVVVKIMDYLPIWGMFQ